MSTSRCEAHYPPGSRCVQSRVQFDSALCWLSPSGLSIADSVVLKPQLLHWNVSPLNLLTFALYI